MGLGADDGHLPGLPARAPPSKYNGGESVRCRSTPPARPATWSLQMFKSKEATAEGVLVESRRTRPGHSEMLDARECSGGCNQTNTYGVTEDSACRRLPDTALYGLLVARMVSPILYHNADPKSDPMEIRLRRRPVPLAGGKVSFHADSRTEGRR